MPSSDIQIDDFSNPILDSLKDAATGERADDSEITSRERRLRIIWTLLQHHGRITFDDLLHYIELDGSKIRNVNRKAFYGDIEALEYIFGTRITSIKGTDNSLTYILDNRKRSTTKEDRALVNNRAKSQIASLCAGILLGTNDKLDSLVIQPCKKQRIESLARSQNSGRVQDNCGKLLHDIHSLVWSHTQRRIALDTGTTVEIFARDVLSKLTLPCDNLNRLYVCTNSRGIFNLLGEPTVPVKTIMVGGLQHPQTEAVVGAYAEQFLQATNLHFSISFIGATSVDTKYLTLGADQDYDAGIKNEFLSRSEIRIIVADSSKWGEGNSASYSPFCAIDEKSISLIITDSCTDDQKERINARGVPVLTMR